jgi:hypothetical protein
MKSHLRTDSATLRKKPGPRFLVRYRLWRMTHLTGSSHWPKCAEPSIRITSNMTYRLAG